MRDERTKSARDADREQERIVHLERTKQIWLLVLILMIGVALAKWLEVPNVYVISGIAAWIVFSFHLSFTAVLHELYELNDQLAGRKDEFRRIIERQTKT